MPAQTVYNRDPDRGVIGQLDRQHASDIKSMYNNDVVDILFGLAVVRDTTVTTGRAAKLPAASTPKAVGLVVFSQVYENGPNGELATDGVKPGGILNVARKGRMYVTCEDGCTTGDRLWIRYAGGTLGALRSTDAGGSTCFDSTSEGEWQETVTAGLGAWIEYDFLNK